jgi:hypothetical protein
MASSKRSAANLNTYSRPGYMFAAPGVAAEADGSILAADFGASDSEVWWSG